MVEEDAVIYEETADRIATAIRATLQAYIRPRKIRPSYGMGGPEHLIYPPLEVLEQFGEFLKSFCILAKGLNDE